MEDKNSRILSRLTASLLGLGYFPYFPGTLAAFVTLCVAYLIGRSTGGMALLPDVMIFILLLLVGLLVAADLKRHCSIKDPSWFVLDEAAGMWLALIGLPKDNLLILLAAFIVFRICDIFKPWIIRKVDNMEHPSAIMLDDLLAAVPAWLTGFILWKVL